MPSNRRLRLTALVVALAVMVVLYVTTARRSTYASPFYTRTVAAMDERQSAESRAGMLAEEKSRADRVAKIQGEHDVAVAKAEAEQKLSPVVEDAKEVLATAAAAGKDSVEGQKPVAGRKMMKDDRVVVNEKPDGGDGVAKVGNVPPKESPAKADGSAAQSDQERKVETEMNTILKKGPIIVFSKTRCPFSKKAKHILLELYAITPPPYVVELDTHPLGPLLQTALGKSTGRTTVPNVLINGQSIGGGDDVEKLHLDGKLIDTVQSLGGKRIVEVKKASSAEPLRKREVRLRA